jgi:hypothetical protein
MSADEIEAAQVRNIASKTASRKHNHFVDLFFSINAVILLSSGESMSPDAIEAARVRNAAYMSASQMQINFVDLFQYQCRHSAIFRREYVSG